MSGLDNVVRDLSQTLFSKLGNKSYPLETAIGIIRNTSTPVAVEFHQTGTNVNCRRLASYAPVVNDIVIAIRMGPVYIVLGKVT